MTGSKRNRHADTVKLLGKEIFKGVMLMVEGWRLAGIR
jgi:hypothetical protein